MLDPKLNPFNYSIYPNNITTVGDIKEVMNILISEILEDDDRNLILSKFGSVEIKLNGRLKRSLGRCFYQYNRNTREILDIPKIDFNKDYILYEINNDNKIDTIIHEMMHMLCYLKYNEPVGHDYRWKNECKKYGCKHELGTKVIGYKSEMKNNGIYKYALRCKNCGKILEYKKTITKDYRRKVENHYLIHNKCNSSDLEIIKL